MASAVPVLQTNSRTRLRAFVLPREHGAWGMLLVPLVTGAMAGYPSGDRILWLLLFAAVALGLFCLRTPVEAWLEISPLRPQNEVERRLIYTSTFIYAFVSCVSLAVLMWSARAYELLLLGAAAAVVLQDKALQ
jgi:protein-S-isoprenylcysteine O-methyltransferase Ste14